MKHIIIRILINALALYVANYFVPGFIVDGGLKEYLLAGLVLGLLNTIVRPILKLISFPLIILTLGLFSIIINALILRSVDYIFGFVVISDLLALFWATMVVSFVNIIFSHIKDL